MCDDTPCRYADRAKQIVCKAVVNEDPNAKVRFKVPMTPKFLLHDVKEYLKL